MTYLETLAAVRRYLIASALARNALNVKHAAREIECSEVTVAAVARELGLTQPRGRVSPEKLAQREAQGAEVAAELATAPELAEAREALEHATALERAARKIVAETGATYSAAILQALGGARGIDTLPPC